MATSQNGLDSAIAFEQLWQILGELYQKLGDRFDLQPTPADQPLAQYSNEAGNVTGSLRTLASPEVDWLVYARLHNPQMGFGTMRLTTWLGPQIQVPHLVFEFGTVPAPFFYMDYVPRVDLWAQPDYTTRYYEPLEPTYLALRERPDLSLFVSKGLYIRQFQSPAHLCFRGDATEAVLSLIRTTAHEMCDRWLGWIDEAEAVPSETQSALAQRDLNLRRISAERDPGNAMAIQIFGSELAAQLVRSLWQRPMA